jgi:hypothetical protein
VDVLLKICKRNDRIREIKREERESERERERGIFLIDQVYVFVVLYIHMYVLLCMKKCVNVNQLSL